MSPYERGEEHARNAIVIGRAIADSLFPSVDPLGKPVRLNGRLYEVAGVFEPDQGLFASFGVDIIRRPARRISIRLFASAMSE